MINGGGRGAKEGELGKIVFRAKEEGIANFVIDGEFYTQKGQLIQTNFESLPIQIGKEETNLEKQAKEEQGTNSQSNNAKLQALRINVEGIVPDFKEDGYEYDITIPNDRNDIEVLAIAQNPNAQVEITGNTGLKQGLNTIKIKVVSEDKTSEKIYTIQVTKTANLELANTNLEILAIENVLLYPAFENGITQYHTQVSNDTTRLNILAVPQNEQAEVQIIGKDEIKEGNNEVIVTVTAPNKISKREYHINVYKRNGEEEEQYQKEQEDQKEKLEQAYEIEKISAVKEENTPNQKEQEKKNYVMIGVVGILVVAGIALGSIYYKKKVLKK